ncbi:MAG TPA: DJ-1 family protein, partial [Lachnospiraceae bacterium]
MKKVAIFFADGFEEIEALTVVDVLRRAKMEVTLVSMKGI